MVLKHPASSQEEHGAPAGTRTPIDGLGNRSSMQLAQLQKSFRFMELANCQTIMAYCPDLQFAYVYAPKRNY